MMFHCIRYQLAAAHFDSVTAKTLGIRLEAFRNVSMPKNASRICCQNINLVILVVMRTLICKCSIHVKNVAVNITENYTRGFCRTVTPKNRYTSLSYKQGFLKSPKIYQTKFKPPSLFGDIQPLYKSNRSIRTASTRACLCIHEAAANYIVFSLAARSDSAQ